MYICNKIEKHMKKLSFKDKNDLKAYISNNDLEGIVHFVSPYYIDAIVGLSDDNRFVYNYDKMIDSLGREYEDQGIENPYETAQEWIDYNCCMDGAGFPIIQYGEDDEF